ncbi:MAG: tetratricopeptide repeat protein [Alphaproteobacteria bacterium]|nr:tetratricopeptide repeat protein [Alphaproteobacteria bacterium]
MLLLSLLLARATEVPDLYQRSYDAEATANYGGALAALAELPSSEKSTYVFLVRRAWLAYLKGDFDASVRDYDAAAKVAPDAVEPELGKLLPLLAARRWLDADNTAKALLAEDPGNTLARSRRAWALFNLGRFADAEAEYRKVLAAYPADVEMMAGIGWCRAKQGDAAGAKKMFEAVLHVAPRHASALAGLAAI